MNHLMIDLETLSLQPNAVVFQAGVVVFDETGNMSTKIRYDLDILPQIMIGRHFDPETQKWWMEQPASSWVARNRFSVNQFIFETNRMIEEFDIRFVWANSPSFDCVILRSLAKEFAVDLKWDFRSEMDVRTLKSMNGILGLPPEEKRETTHDSLKDCIDQVLKVVHYMDNLRKATVVNGQ